MNDNNIGKNVLTVICGMHSGTTTNWIQRKFTLDGVQVMGRETEDSVPAVFIPSEVTTVSPEQGAFITEQGKTFYQASPYAVNQLYRGTDALSPGVNHELRDGDILVLYGDDTQNDYADVFFVYSNGLGGNDLDINITDRSVMEKGKKKYLLKDIKINIPQGHMVLILGGSGAGKTTFMNAVMGYEPANGKILYNGRDIYTNFENMKYEIGYVPQQDLLRMSDTVYSTLMDAAKMRLPSSYSSSMLKSKVEETMRMLGLKKEQFSRVDKLSGGQRKRLSIAVEYIGNPSLFFLDEPDSGLDSGMATELMKNLRAIANQGKIVIVISHSPNRVAQIFDDVIVLAKSEIDNCGYLAFYGDTDEACKFFGVTVKENDDLEGIVSRINRREEGGEGKGDYFIQAFREGKVRQ